MIRLRTILFAALLLGSCTTHEAPQSEGAERTILGRARAVRAMRHLHADAWEGFDDARFDVPMRYCTDSRCHAVNPTEMLRERFGARLAHEECGLRIYRMAQPDSTPLRMATRIEFSDSTDAAFLRPYICCSSPEITRRTEPDVASDSVWMPMVMHEYAHGYQYAHRAFCPELAGALPTRPELQLARLHRELEWFDRAIRTENRALLEVHATDDTQLRDGHIREFLSARASRKKRMAAELGPEAVRDAKFYELMEGMARYIEAEAGFRLGSYTAQDTRLYDTDRSGYIFATGYNLVRQLLLTGVGRERMNTICKRQKTTTNKWHA